MLKPGLIESKDLIGYQDPMDPYKLHLGEESLKSSEVGVHVDRHKHCLSQLVEADSLHHTECMGKQRHKFYVCQIHILFKMLLHNREDLVNFDQVLGNSSFHEKK